MNTQYTHKKEKPEFVLRMNIAIIVNGHFLCSDSNFFLSSIVDLQQIAPQSYVVPIGIYAKSDYSIPAHTHIHYL